jgi:hypothetical protein
MRKQNPNIIPYSVTRDRYWGFSYKEREQMCKRQKKPRLTKEDFIIPENWEPDTPIVKEIHELRKKVIAGLGPDMIQEILAELGIEEEKESGCVLRSAVDDKQKLAYR